MKVLVLCGYFESIHQKEITDKTKTWVENAANSFQRKMLQGLAKQRIDLEVVSAPFIGAWPTVYSEMFFRGFSEETYEKEFNLSYVTFNNIWGYRNLSRTKALKRKIKVFAEQRTDEKKVIIVYSPHTPFLDAAVYAKSLDAAVHICMVVPDLPQYMNLSKKKHPIYDFFKAIDIRKFKKLSREVESYVLLTEPMKQVLEVDTRPYIVVEGIMDGNCVEPGMQKSGKKIAYAGKLIESFGVKHLLQAFELIEDPEVSLEICGGGELREYIEERASEDKRIHYHGVLTAECAQEMLINANVLVNPRRNDEEYTKYSFPSKNMEYLQTGNVVVAYMLDGMPEIYRDFFCVPEDDTAEALAKCIKDAILNRNLSFRTEKAQTYLMKERSSEQVGKQIVSMIEENVF